MPPINIPSVLDLQGVINADKVAREINTKVANALGKGQLKPLKIVGESDKQVRDISNLANALLELRRAASNTNTDASRAIGRVTDNIETLFTKAEKNVTRRVRNIEAVTRQAFNAIVQGRGGVSVDKLTEILTPTTDVGKLGDQTAALKVLTQLVKDYRKELENTARTQQQEARKAERETIRDLKEKEKLLSNIRRLQRGTADVVGGADRRTIATGQRQVGTEILREFAGTDPNKVLDELIRRGEGLDDLADRINKVINRTKETQAVQAKEAKDANVLSANLKRAAKERETFNKLLTEAERLQKLLNIPETEEVKLLREQLRLREQIIGRGGQGGRPIDAQTQTIVSRVKEQNKLNASIERGRVTLRGFGEAAALAFKRYGAFLSGSLIIFKVVNAFRQATSAALEFEKSVTQIQQVLSITPQGVDKIARSIRASARATGVRPTEIAGGVFTFAQAGFKDPQQLANVAEQISRIPLAATFGSIEQTTSGLLAIMGQFNKELDDTGRILDLVNQFAADFAVESADIFEGVKRGGATFATAGGQIEEFIALFSVLRESTRESAETLGTFFKTGFGRLLNPQSQQLLRQLGVTADNVLGQVQQLAELFGSGSPLSGEEQINVAQQLVGVRQFARLLALLREVRDPEVQGRIQQSLILAGGSVERQAASRLDDIGQSLERLRTNFQDLAIEVTQNEAIKKLVSDFTNVATSVLKVIGALQDFIPLLLTIGAVALAPKIGTIAQAALARINPNLANFSLKDIGQLPITAKTFFGTGRRAIATVGGAALGAGLLGSNILGDTELGTGTSRFTGRNVTDALNAGLIQGLVVGAINPWAGAVIGTIAFFSQLSKAIDENRKAFVANTLTQQKTSQERINIALGTGAPVSLGTQGVLGEFTRSFRVNAARINVLLNGTEENIEKFIAEAFEAPAGRGKIRQTFGDLGFLQFLPFGARLRRLGREEEGIDFTEDEIKTIVLKQLVTSGGDEVGRSLLLAIQSAINEVGDDVNQQITTTPGLNVSDFNRLFNEGLRTRLLQEFQAADELRESLGLRPLEVNLNVLNQFLSIIKQLSSVTFPTPPLTSGRFRNEIREAARNLRTVLSSVAVLGDIFNQQLTEQLDLLNNIVIDSTSLVRANLSSNNLTLLRQNDFGIVADLSELSLDISSVLIDFNKRFKTGIDIFLENLGGPDLNPEFETNISAVIQSIVQNVSEGLQRGSERARQDRKVSEEVVKQFGNLFEFLSAITGQTFDQLFKELFTDSDDILGNVRGLLNERSDEIANLIRRQAEIFNRRLELERQLEEQLLGLNQNIFDINQNIRSLQQNLEDRVSEQEAFINDLTESQIVAITAGRLRGRAQATQFNQPIGQFISQVLAAAQNRNLLVGAAGQANISGVNIFTQQGVFEQSLQAQIEFLRQQQLLNQRLDELDGRISAASQASDILRQAFLTLRTDLQSAGQAVQQFTERDLTESVDALQKFIEGGGLNNVTAGLEGLTPQRFTALQRLLQAIGNIDVGGFTGAQLLGDINKELGIAFAAAIRSAVTGETSGQAADFIRQQLQDLRDQQQAAFDLERQLREEQILLVETQRKLVELEQQFVEDQRITLQRIASAIQNNDQFDRLRDTVSETNQILIKGFEALIEATGGEGAATPFKDLIDQIRRENKRSLEDLVKTPNIVEAPRNILPSLPDRRPLEIPSHPFFPEPLIPIGPGIPGITTPRQPREFPTQIPSHPFFPEPRLPLRPRNVTPIQNPDVVPPSISRPNVFDIPGGFGGIFRGENIQRVQGPQADTNIGVIVNLDNVINRIDSINETLSALTELNAIGNHISIISDNLIFIKNELEKSVNEPTRFTLEVSPVQVNVALTAPDILAMAGPQIKSDIMRSIGIKLSAIFGDDVEKSSQISSSFANV